MRSSRVSTLVFLFGASFAAGEITLTEGQEQFRAEVSARVKELEKKDTSVFAGPDGWLFLASELRFLAHGKFWGAGARASSRGKAADPLPAILDFHRQLRERGIDLLLVPVPPKVSVYPEKFSAAATVTAVAAPYLRQFYEELRAAGVDVLDLTPLFLQHRDQGRGPVFCETDSHWSGLGCVLAAQAIAERVKPKLPAALARKEYLTDWKQLTITGDLAALLPADRKKPATEKIAVRTVTEKANGNAVQPAAESPLLLLGDSHTLVYRELLAERAGLLDQLAAELDFAADLIGTRGSGATAVRISLYRKTRNDPAYLAKKKVIVWCFAAREFTETDQGWVQQPISR